MNRLALPLLAFTLAAGCEDGKAAPPAGGASAQGQAAKEASAPRPKATAAKAPGKRAPAKKAPGMLAVGDTPPALSLLDHKGARVDLATLKGKKALVWFYPKADTGG